jgi:hypothetical protein
MREFSLNSIILKTGVFAETLSPPRSEERDPTQEHLPEVGAL